MGLESLSIIDERNSAPTIIRNQEEGDDRLPVTQVATNALNEASLATAALPRSKLLTSDQALDLVQDDGLELRNLSPAQQNNPFIVQTAVKQNNLALQYASESQRSNPEILALIDEPEADQFITPRGRTVRSLQRDPLVLQKLSLDEQNDPELALIAVRKDGLALQYASRERQNDPKIVLEAMRQNPKALQHASEEFKSTFSEIRSKMTDDKETQAGLKCVAFYRRLEEECFAYYGLPGGVQRVVSYLEEKGRVPKGSCIVCESSKDFQEKFNQNKDKFQEKPMAFLVRDDKHWLNLIVHKNIVINTDALGWSSSHKLNILNIADSPLPTVYSSSTKRQLGSGCWVFAVRDAVELLRMEWKYLENQIDKDKGEFHLPPELLKSTQSAIDDATKNQPVYSTKGTINLEEILKKHESKKSKEDRNTYINERKEKYIGIVRKKLQQELNLETLHFQCDLNQIKATAYAIKKDDSMNTNEKCLAFKNLYPLFTDEEQRVIFLANTLLVPEFFQFFKNQTAIL